jgi:hypothetical protein
MAARVLRCAECGEAYTALRSDKQTCSPRCRKRLSRRSEPLLTLDDRYERGVWDARRRGLLDPHDALLLLVKPSAKVLQRLGAVAA